MPRPSPRGSAPAPLAALALIGVVALTACGNRADTAGGTTASAQPGAPSTSATPSAGDPGGLTTGIATGPTGPPPLGTFPTDVPGDTSLTGVAGPTKTPPPFTAPPVNNHGSRQDDVAAINASYDTFIANLTGLFQYQTPQWRDALAEVATPDMTLAATRTAVAIKTSKSHTIGALKDSSRKVTINPKGNEALVTSCLDEKHWYAVKNETGRPDPGITRGYFTGRATFIFTSHRWYVNTWNSLPTHCTFLING